MYCDLAVAHGTVTCFTHPPQNPQYQVLNCSRPICTPHGPWHIRTTCYEPHTHIGILDGKNKTKNITPRRHEPDSSQHLDKWDRMSPLPRMLSCGPLELRQTGIIILLKSTTNNQELETWSPTANPTVGNASTNETELVDYHACWVADPFNLDKGGTSYCTDERHPAGGSHVRMLGAVHHLTPFIFFVVQYFNHARHLQIATWIKPPALSTLSTVHTAVASPSPPATSAPEVKCYTYMSLFVFMHHLCPPPQTLTSWPSTENIRTISTT